MKTKSILIALALIAAGTLAAQLPSIPKLIIAADTLLDNAATNRNYSRAVAPLSEYAEGYFAGKAAALEELAATVPQP
jgi:hypothetical protein